MLKLLKSQKPNNTGFTLIELLVVVLIISVLSGIVLSLLNSGGVRAKSRDAQRISNLKTIQSALELRFADYRSYPISDGGGGAGTSELVSSGSELGKALQNGYLNSIPLDPVNDGSDTDACGSDGTYRYNYRTDATGSIYILTARTELTTSAEDSPCDSANLNNWSTLGCGITTGCYGVENP